MTKGRCQLGVVHHNVTVKLQLSHKTVYLTSVVIQRPLEALHEPNPGSLASLHSTQFDKGLMPKEYIGHLPPTDPLHPYLREHILPQAGVNGHHADFRVFSMKRAKVYLYEEKHSRTHHVGKFFADGKHTGAESVERMRREFDNLRLLRSYGLAGYPHHVVRPLGANDSLNSILVEEYCGGVPL